MHRSYGSGQAPLLSSFNGKEVRFLRTEMLLSQSSLARLLQLDEQTVARWEKGRTNIPGPADGTLRLLYLEHIGGNEKISVLLREIADLEDDNKFRRFTLEETSFGWDLGNYPPPNLER